MKLITIILLLSAIQANAQLQTRWAKEVNETDALKEYPRPQMVRTNWTNLNGLWDYAITPKDAELPNKTDGTILVPYPLESSSSGIKKQLLPSQNLWYKRTIQKPELKNGERLLLHFGAVDWQASVYVNGNEVGGHTGGYTEFTLDITDKMQNGENSLMVKVYDPSDQGIGPHGKQVLNPKDIYYTPSSGVWQTVWMEIVPDNYIESLRLIPDIDRNQLILQVNGHGAGYTLETTALDGSKVVGKATNLQPGLLQTLSFGLNPVKLWSPDHPFLYDLQIKLIKDGKVVDEVKSYFGMRKIAIKNDRIYLNNQYTYNLGVLDQGFWPDGLYTAPTDEALAYDIKAIKAMGFNTIRKHIKVEPARWYYWADKLGMLVWQDMVSPNQGLPEGSKAAFEQQSKETIEQLWNYPCITTWVLFNEKWGQYDQKRLTDWIKQMDPTRLVNGHTGELLYVNEQLRSPSPDAYVDADMTDVHSYPDPMMPIKQAGKAQVVGEFGGIGVAISGHEWTPFQGWGYIKVTPAQLEGKYQTMVENLKLLEEQGLSGSIYTQPFDVEGEENGLMTYDREVVKIPFEHLRKINSLLVPNTTVPNVTAQNASVADESKVYAGLLDDFVKGKRDTAFLKDLALMAIRVGDKPGGSKVANSYIATLKAPLSAEQFKFVNYFTKSTKDPGFAFLQGNDRASIVSRMNIIYAGEIAPELVTTPDWGRIESKTKVYGAAGEEIFLRAKTIDALNKKDWETYVPTAKSYLEKYGQYLKTQDKVTFQNAIDQHAQ